MNRSSKICVLLMFGLLVGPLARATPTPTPTANGKIVFAEGPYTSVPPTPTPFEDGPQIRQMDSDGANVTAVTYTDTMHPSRYSPKWSYDGTKLLYIEQRIGAPFGYLFDIVANGHYISIGEGSGGAGWSPDGSKIVFSEYGHLYVVNEDGSNRTNLNQFGSNPCWAPDGTKIAFDVSGGIRTMNPDGTNPIILTNTSDSQPAWSPDGTKIAFVRGNEIYVMNANGSNQTRITNNADPEDSPSWSPDGTQLAFASQRSEDYASQIYTMNADGSNQVRISNNIYPDYQPHWRWSGVIVPTPTPVPLVTVSGNVSYCSAPTSVSVPNVALSLAGGASNSVLSDSNGNYGFSSLTAGGSYTVTPTKSGLTSGSAGINTVDVIAVQRHYLGVALLSGCPFMAADVNGDTSITTVDVIAVQRFFLGITTGTANVGKYQFTPASRNYLTLGSDQTNQNYDTLIFGDVAPPFVTP